MIKDEHDFEVMFQRTYYHMIDRIKKDIISINIVAREVHESHKQRDTRPIGGIREVPQGEGVPRASEDKLQQLVDFIDKDQRHREERIESLNKSIKKKEEALQRRMDRVARQ